MDLWDDEVSHTSKIRFNLKFSWMNYRLHSCLIILNALTVINNQHNYWRMRAVMHLLWHSSTPILSILFSTTITNTSNDFLALIIKKYHQWESNVLACNQHLVITLLFFLLFADCLYLSNKLILEKAIWLSPINSLSNVLVVHIYWTTRSCSLAFLNFCLIIFLQFV